jgi:cyanophycinase
MAIGGNEQKRGRAALLREFVGRAGGPDARIVVIPAASVEPEIRALQYARIFHHLGAGRVRSVHAERGLTRDELMLVNNASGIFVTGGDQAQLMFHLRRTGCDAAIVDAVANGAVYAGTSAGAAAVSGRMIAGGERGHVVFGNGLGLVSGVIVDQHFSQRRRLTRLTYAAREHGLIGVGIDEDTAMIWERDGRTYVAGSGRVTIVEP